MVNASLNWASIVGIVLAVGGAMLYFMRSFKPALARDYDVFFAAIGLLCGGILFFQGWRLDPILQFGQFLLAGTTVFFAYESVRLRGVSTEQARRSAYFEDEPAPPRSPAGGLGGEWNSPYDRFDEAPPLRRRFRGVDDEQEDEEAPERDFYRPRRASRAAIPEQAASRRRGRDESESSWGDESERERRMARFGRNDSDPAAERSNFGERRNLRKDQRRGSRPTSSSSTSARGRREPEDASFSPSSSRRTVSDRPTPSIDRQPSSEGKPSRASSAAAAPSERPTPRSSRPRDNSSRFDD
ncbi:putative conserved hypothetical protein Ycf66 [Synechococcus sp. RS9909]|uniref:Ycf66 family protein n=1 Tax=unclassified Synechococcus TaxID=2626047 RepID=UPI000068F91A|nr:MULTISPECIES: Ycf66 family protein [unclassified Synechococcus]EAQ68340.1 hypothetical protein RS9917_07830 [Synechococcus sp. RS9917]QNI80396.1 putative conserved hypothetical protein Ycf66 [Synechococcus sp. RS9909]